MNELEVTIEIFDKIKYLSKNNVEFWSARELYPVLEYTSWDKFLNVINKAIQACNGSGQNAADHFSHMGKMVKLGSGAKREAI